jgi:hypothetical protein
MEENKKDRGETILTIVGIVFGILVVVQWTLFYLIDNGIIKF